MLERPAPKLWSLLLLPADSEVAGQPVLCSVFPVTCLSSDSTSLHLALWLIIPVPGYKPPASLFFVRCLVGLCYGTALCFSFCVMTSGSSVSLLQTGPRRINTLLLYFHNLLSR